MNFDGRLEAAIVVPSGGWSVSASNGSGGPNTCTIAAGTYFPSDDAGNGLTGLVSAFAAALNASRPSGWTVTLSTGLSGTGLVTITGSGAWSITFTSGELGNLLGFGGSASGSGGVAGGSQCAALWMPDCPLALDGDPRTMPAVTDARSTMSPNMVMRTVVGNIGYRHRRPRYTHLPRARVWKNAETTTGASWETLMKNTQLGLGGYSSMAPGSAMQVYDASSWYLGRTLGSGGGSLTGWQFSPSIASIELAMVQDQYTGLWRLDLPDLVTSG